MWGALGPCGTFAALIVQVRRRFVHGRITFCFLSYRFMLRAWALGPWRQASPAAATMCSRSSLGPYPTSMAPYFEWADVRPFSVRLAAEVTWCDCRGGSNGKGSCSLTWASISRSVFLSLGIAAWALDQQSRVGAFKQMGLGTVWARGSIYVNHLWVLRAGFPFDVLTIVAGIRVQTFKQWKWLEPIKNACGISKFL